MSYDLHFLALEAGESWDDAMARLEADATDDVPLDDEAVARWKRVKAALKPILPNAVENTAPTYRELDDDATTLQISLYATELSLSVPYWHSGADAERLVGLLREVCAAIEQVTGLTAYDPQADAPFLGDGEHRAAQTFDYVVDTVLAKHTAPRQQRVRAVLARLFGRRARRER